MTGNIAGIDVHKRVLMATADQETEGDPAEAMRFDDRRFGTTTSELEHLKAWLDQHGVEEVVMESTAQYWKPVWLALAAAAAVSGQPGTGRNANAGVGGDGS